MPKSEAGGRRCALPFPAARAVLDANVIMRFYNCGALHVLRDTVQLVVSAHVYKECTRAGPEVRQRLRGLSLDRRALLPGTLEWEHLALMRGGLSSPRNLGEDESIAVCLAEAKRGRHLPFVTYDRRATALAAACGVVTIDFLDTLAWLVGCHRLAAEDADEIEVKAAAYDGWKRPHGYGGSIDAARVGRQMALITLMKSSG